MRTIAGVGPCTVSVHAERAVSACNFSCDNECLTRVRVNNFQLATGVQGRCVVAFAHRHRDRTHCRKIVRTSDVDGDRAAGCAVNTLHCDALADLLTSLQFIVRIVACESPCTVCVHIERAVGARNVLGPNSCLTRICISDDQFATGIQC